MRRVSNLLLTHSLEILRYTNVVLSCTKNPDSLIESGFFVLEKNLGKAVAFNM